MKPDEMKTKSELLTEIKLLRLKSEQNEFYQQILENIHDLLSETDQNGRFTYISPRSFHVLGYHPDEMIGKYPADFMPPDFAGGFMTAMIEKIKKQEGFSLFESSFLHKEGYFVKLETSGTIRYSKNGLFLGYHLISRDITLRKQTEKALVESEMKYRSLVSNLPDIVLVHNEGNIFYTNETATRITGYTREELIGKSIFDYLDEKSKPIVAGILESRSKGEIPEVYQVEIVTKNQTLRTVEVRADLIEYDNQKMYLTVLTDITDRNKALSSLRENEERFRLITENTTDLIIELDMDWNILYLNSSYIHTLGYSPSELVGKPFNFNDIFPDDRAELISLLDEVRNDHSRVYFNYRNRNRQGDWRWFNSIANPFQTSSGEWHIAFIARDITDRKLIEQELMERHHQLLQIIDLVPHYIGVRDWNGFFVIVNRYLAESYNKIQEELVGKNILDLYQNLNEAQQVLNNDREIIHSGKPMTLGESIYMDQKGEKHIVYVHKEPFHFKGRKTVLEISLDLTNHKKTEAALIESEKKYKELADSLPQTVFEINNKGTLLYFNNNSLKQFGYTREDLHNGLNIDQFFIKEDIQRMRKNLRHRLKGGEPENQEFNALRKDGTVFPVNIYTVPVKKNEKITGMRGVIVDITERKKTEENIMKSVKLESVGILAGGIAHDFNNILTAILGNISLAKYYLAPEDKIYGMLTDAEKASLRAKNLSQQLLTLSKGGMPVKLLSNLPQLIKEAADFVLHGSNVSCDYFFDSDLWTAEVDPGQISQVVHNLVLNSRQAMPDGGKITICGENYIYSDKNLNLPMISGDYVKISVKDTGHGIPKENFTRVFDPYYTTKDGGHGLGLATTYSIIKNHRGSIELKSEPNKETVFTFYLPATSKTPNEAGEQPTIQSLEKAHILVLEDEENIIQFLETFFKKLNYDSDFSRDGKETVKLYTKAIKEGNPYDLVILDLTIPGGMGGRETLTELKKIDPDVKAAVSSGYSNDSVMSNYQEYGFRGVIPKPYRVEELHLRIRNIIRDETILN